MKNKITFAELRQISPYKAGKLIMALNRNRVDAKKSASIPKNFRQELTKYILTQWQKN